ncbi:cation diffusion facilitator family transporter [Aurantimonas sp. C2-6-R+9]|uniref:cation diffusion facilitator family transporter n=2 Tax=Aurantimonas TaxID=182269 RepID=UPI002E181546|nr:MULTISPECIES: cation diffusion facilitator family transporter [unclassified Aurantimonas]MEC5292003.1 cation diffusion facilitator family transporter [Aurantimonas sp. C2-3-R2]MEC5382155.1 cation diffusion facilitator family transporter [Aurantimonas sp. C2-6-R+9]MEC5413089.1 cation diffusion facilitator family transporter [Aurantimonas sp. C2-4-R8]
MTSVVSETSEAAAPLVKRIAMASVAIGVIVLAIKYAAYHVTGSVALFSDALESIVNVVAGLIALWAVTLSYKPADSDHPFGHTKAEYFSAVVEGVLIVVAALLILREAWAAYLVPRSLDEPLAGIAINAVATVINAGWAVFLIRRGRDRRSPALAADGQHIMADVVTSVGVLGGLLLATVTGWTILDPLMAAFVALNILREGFKVVTSSLSGLMDQAIDPVEEASVRDLISAHAEGAIEVHDLKTRLAGRAMFIEFHMVVPEAMTVGVAHDICDRIEDALQEAFAGARVSIHVEPEGEAKQTGVPVL